MKKATILASAALVVTGLVGSQAHPAAAALGCGVTVEVHNKSTSNITVNWASSDSRAGEDLGWLGVAAGTWKKLDTGSTTVTPGSIGSRAVTLDLSCNTLHQYRIWVTQGSNSSWAKYPADTSKWTTNTTPHLDVY